ncbi:MAG: DCC1-like thiol-disulfide oxidoreductase family protein [Actinomycetes bacterium]
MSQPSSQIEVILDGSCPVCSAMASFAGTRCGDRATFASSTSFDDVALAERGLTRPDVEERLWVISSDGEARGGIKAVAGALRALNGAWPALGWMLETRIGAWLGEPAYRWVAARRHSEIRSGQER